MADQKVPNLADAEFLHSKIPEKLASNQADKAILSEALAATHESDAEAMLCSKYRGARLLVVEDNPANREVAQKLILAAGLKVDMAANGQEAVEKATQMHYDMILMDVQMPIMNGLEATRAIRLQPGKAEVPILAMTASAFAEARSPCLEAGMQDLVAKPVNHVEFYTTLLKWLSATEPRADSEPAVAPIHSEQNAQLHMLAGISGLDPDSGLATMGGDYSKYSAGLKLLAEQCHRYAEKLSGMHARGEFSAIELLAGSFRGNAIMLGARKVAEAAGAAVSACRLKTGTEATSGLCSMLVDELLRLADAIQNALPESVVIANTAIDRAQLADTLTQLETFLEYGNIEANHLAKKNAGLLVATFGKKAEGFLARIEAFDYENAAAELRQMRCRLNGGAG